LNVPYQDVSSKDDKVQFSEAQTTTNKQISRRSNVPWLLSKRIYRIESTTQPLSPAR